MTINKLKQNIIEIFDNMSNQDNNYILEFINKSDNIIEILAGIENDNNLYKIAHVIFHLIYLESNFKEYVYWLLHKEYVKPEDLSLEEIENMVSQTSWGLEYIYHNLERILNREYMNIVISIILEKIKDNELIYQMFLNKVLMITNQQIRDKFIEETIKKHISFDNNNILRSFYQNHNEFEYQQECIFMPNQKPKLVLSELPYFLLYYSRYNQKIENLMFNNFEMFFQAEASRKLSILERFYIKLPINICNRYAIIYNLYSKQKALDMDKILTILINSKEENIINNFIKNKSINYYRSGSTTRVFKVEDKVLKFTLKKHEPDTEQNLFLIAPTETTVIYDNNRNPILTVEIQDYLSKKYHGIQMTSEDIKNFFIELDKQGYTVTDPKCLRKHYDNFGFLNDYHDADMTGFDDAEDLPTWFKERPIVLYDVDLIYKKDSPKKKTFGNIT